ncbi:DUF397 domain-containing protein [Amycolatopsis vancoresmycina]|uniref:DUF397 domain-containing protein n=1 Tax=Amycolatopsis vancoresmycina DSM 44592 TaxID=1292037 RepID=R1I9P7_9PSEU|nr:DUF397 domain-containing protein [Amycolatopsis vancoresmycina]EOD69276.1 hypothetical protein H480_06723 [Amycolatopsis vancoresmycina DSM 44592]
MIDQGSWRKSSYSGSDANCVEVSSTSTTVGVRDTKDREGGHLTIPASAWTAFIHSAGRTS